MCRLVRDEMFLFFIYFTVFAVDVVLCRRVEVSDHAIQCVDAGECFVLSA